MSEKELMLSKDFTTWLKYAESNLVLSLSEETAMWYNKHKKGKYLICEAKEDNSTKLFNYTVVKRIRGKYCRDGFHRVFTITRTPVNKGYYLAKVVELRFDKNGFLNLVVDVVKSLDNIEYKRLSSFNSTSKWNSLAWWLLMVGSNEFFEDFVYDKYSHEPNFDALTDTFPELKGLNTEEIGKVMLNKYINNGITIFTLEDILRTSDEKCK